MLAYHNKPELKQQVLDEMAMHREAEGKQNDNRKRTIY